VGVVVDIQTMQLILKDGEVIAVVVEFVQIVGGQHDADNILAIALAFILANIAFPVLLVFAFDVLIIVFFYIIFLILLY